MSTIRPLCESTLRGFFLDEVTATELRERVASCVEHLNATEHVVHLRRDLSADFPVTRSHLLKLCQSALDGDLPPDALPIIAFALHATDHFLWDSDEDEVLAAVLSDWSAPEICYPLTTPNLKRFQRWLLGTEAYPRPPLQASKTPRSDGRLISSHRAHFHD